MKLAVWLLFSATILGLILSSPMEVQPLLDYQTSESAMLLLLGLSLIGVARIFRTETIKF